jgi:hypothetical protein
VYIKANYEYLLKLAQAMYLPPRNSKTKYLFYVQNIDGLGYCEWTQQIENKITFDYDIVQELPITEEI